jgi:hypothetical protein
VGDMKNRECRDLLKAARESRDGRDAREKQVGSIAGKGCIHSDLVLHIQKLCVDGGEGQDAVSPLSLHALENWRRANRLCGIGGSRFLIRVSAD